MPERVYIECGKIINTHGCLGGLKLESWCNSPEELARLKTIYLFNGSEYSPAKIVKASVFKQFVLMTLDTVTDMDQAIALKGKTVFGSDRLTCHRCKRRTGLRNRKRADQSRGVGYLCDQYPQGRGNDPRGNRLYRSGRAEARCLCNAYRRNVF